jgi:hypothetical protein
MFVVTLPNSFKVGDTMSCQINGADNTVHWLDKATLVIGENNDHRGIFYTVPARNPHDHKTFFCEDADHD